MDCQNSQDPIPATAQPQPTEQTNTPVKVDNTVPLSQVEEETFTKYANMYDINESPSPEKRDNINREKYVYSGLNSKGIENTAVEQLLNFTISDINHQYSMKSAMESKAGFLAALWGVLIGIVVSKELYITLINGISNTPSTIGKGLYLLIFLGLIGTALVALIEIAFTLIAGEYSRYQFDDKEDNFKCAVDDKNMMFTKLLDSNTNVWKKNEETNEKKYTYLRNSVIWIFFLIIFLIISIALQIN